MKSMILDNVPVQDYASIEAFNTLATNVTFSGSQYKVIMMTSCVANEGKSYIAVNLIRRLANMGYRTVLIDADLRKSVFFSRYNVQTPNQIIGLTHYLAGRARMEDIIYKTNLNNVFVVPIGKEVINSLPLLSSSSFTDLLNVMRANFDFVIVDSPPVGLVIDAAMVASACDATILVVTNEKISRGQLIEAKRQIEKSGCMLLGTVLNKVSMDTHKSKKYYYKSYYSHYGSEEYTMKPAADTEEKINLDVSMEKSAYSTQGSEAQNPYSSRANHHASRLQGSDRKSGSQRSTDDNRAFVYNTSDNNNTEAR